MKLLTKMLGLLFLVFLGLSFIGRTHPVLAVRTPMDPGGLVRVPVVQEWSDSCQNNRSSFQTFTAGCDDGNSDNMISSLSFSIYKYLNPISVDGRSLSNGPVQKIFAMVNHMSLAEPPVSSAYYLADISKSLGIGLIPDVYATETGFGIGFSAFAVVLKLWRAFANIAFGLMAIVFLVIGFLIMFRSKLSAQSEITIQSALPRLLITMVLIAFSYPIAGFMVDLMYLIIYGFIGFLNTNGLIDSSIALKQLFISQPFSAILGKGFVVGPTSSITDAASQSAQDLLGTSFGDIISSLAESASSVLFGLLLTIFLLFIAFKIFVILLKAYAYIIMQVVLAPLYILGNAFPGSSAFSSWLKGLAAKLAVFPIVIFHIIIAAILVNASGWGATSNLLEGSGSGQIWSPPLMNFGSKLSTGMNGILAIIGLGILYMAPNATEMAEQLFKGQLNINLGQSLSGAGQQFIYPAKQAWERQKYKSHIKKQAEAIHNIDKRGGN